MPTITVEMVRELNKRLEARGVATAIAEREYPDALYDQNLIAQTGTSDVAPLIIDEITYTNCGTVKQTITAGVEKKVTDSITLKKTHGVKVGLKVGFEISLGIKFKNELEIGYNFQSEDTQVSTEEILYKFSTPLEIPPMKRVVFQAVVQQEKVKDVPYTMMVFLKGGAVSVVPKGLVKLQRWYNGTDHFYTAWVEHPEDHGYGEEASPGYLFSFQAPGTVPLFRYWNGTDHFYTTNYDELREGAHGWQKESIAGYVYADAQPGTLPLYRYWNGTDHFYTTDYGELGEARHGYQKEGIAGHLASAAMAEQGVIQDVAALFPDLADRTFEIKGTFKGESTVREANILLLESEATQQECQILATKLGGGGNAARSAPKGLYEVRTPEAELVGKKPIEPQAKPSPGLRLQATAYKPERSTKPPRVGRK
ncbi:ETX/MTX2 family pore-forming toxin [Nannocystis sp. SCPEA4]|uniref:ETX/MTX2 family pore-forming toxin n=1 Tax=Nannocystis sp. SCPEA4 TaxID=2996787 RepID=UPI00226D5FB2|nr:ETX/MTX2 family pore-forming toxin [Nannocystis sp. SCPEA4]MCY1062336.1 ETX/MTX2 family pore-forming toxin [Nannocystis sp. SCPEA4]